MKHFIKTVANSLSETQAGALIFLAAPIVIALYLVIVFGAIGMVGNAFHAMVRGVAG